MEFNTTLALTDSQLNLLLFDNFSSASIEKDQIYNDSELVIENARSDCNSGIFKFKNVKVTLTPNSTPIFKITVNYDINLFFSSTPENTTRDLNKLLTLESNMKLFVRPCIRGEILMPDNSCHKCERGKQ